MDISVPTVMAPPRAPNVLRLQQLVRVLRRHVWLILFCAIAAAAGIYVAARTAPKVYTANASITVEGDRFAIPELQGALRNDAAPDPMPWVRTEVQALTSRALLSQVIAALRLEQDPEFNPALRPPTFVQQVREQISALVMPLLPHGPASAPAAGPDEAVLSAVGKALSVFHDNRSLVISLSFTSQDPRRASEIVNTLLERYVQSRASRRIAANEGASANISQRVDQVRADLAAIEERMRALRSKGELVGLRAGSVGQQQAEELATAAARATLERSQLEINFERATAAAKGGSTDAVASVLNSPTISRLRDQEASASRRLAELSSRYGSSYPGVRSIAAEVGSARQQIAEEAGRIVSSLGAQLRAAREQEASVQRQLDLARRDGVQSQNARAELDQLQQESAGRRTLYQTLLERMQQTAAQPNGAEVLDVRVISPAVPPGAPSGPNVKLAALMGGAGGAMLGCLIALMRIRSVEGFETAADVADITGLPVLATLPRKLLRARRGLLAAAPATTGPDAVAMRQLRERLRYGGRTGSPRSIAVVPVLDEGGGALLGAALARSAALAGERVLLIDGDEERPKLAKLLGARAVPAPAPHDGDTAEEWNEAVARDVTGVSLLPHGANGRGTARDAAVALQNLLAEAAQEYDLVLIVGGAAGSAGAARLARQADAAVLLVEGRTRHAAVQDAVERLSASGRTPLMAVLAPAR